VGRIEQLHEFRSHLVAFNRELADSFASMNAHSRSIQEDWNDQQYQKFVSDFEDVARGIKRYLDRSEDHEAYLRTLIERLIAVAETQF